MDNSNWICKWTILNKVHLKLATLATATFTINIEVIFFTIVCITLKKKKKLKNVIARFILILQSAK